MITTTTTTVCNIRRFASEADLPADLVYVGRKMPRGKFRCVKAGSPFGNPKSTGGSLSKYFHHVKADPILLAALPALRGKCLACWCGEWDGLDDDQAPACHAAVLAHVLNNHTDEEIIAGEIG